MKSNGMFIKGRGENGRVRAEGGQTEGGQRESKGRAKGWQRES